VLHQREPDADGADQAEEESRQKPRASTVGIGDMAGWIGNEGSVSKVEMDWD
jgi:hypothetical protein